MAFPKWLHGEFWPQNPKIAPINHVFEFIDLKSICKGHGAPIFFPILLLYIFRFNDRFILFLGQWTQKHDFFGAIFGFWGQNSLWSRLGRATKFYMKEVALNRNFHFKFEGIPTIFGVTMKKKLHICCFRGPFGALLGTPW